MKAQLVLPAMIRVTLHPSCLQVAPIAAQAMDGYMMFSQKLKVHVVKRADVHPELFKGKRIWNLITQISTPHVGPTCWQQG